MVGGTEFLLLFVNLIRNKYLALTIGAEGYGVVSLLTAFFQYANLIAGSWLSTASLKYISEYNSEGKKEEVKVLFNLTFYIVLIVATIIATVFIIFFPVIKTNFLSSEVLFSYYALFAAGFWGTSMTNLFRIVLQGLMDIKKIVRIRLFTQAFNLVTIFLLVYLFDLVGLFMNIAIVSIFTALLYFLAVRKKIKIQKFNIKWYKTDVSKKIFSFSAIDVFLGFIDQTANYLKRILIIDFLSMSSLGLYAASRGILKFLNLFSMGSMFHFKPQMSQSLTPGKRSKGMNDYFRLMLLLGGISSAWVVLFSNEAIRLLYSKDFVGLAPVLFIFILSQFVSNIQLGYMFSVVGMAKLKIHSISIIVSTPFAILIPYYYLTELGLISIGIGAIVSATIRIMIYGTFLGKNYKIYMNYSNLILLILGILVIIIAKYSLDQILVYRIILALSTSLLYFFFLKKKEKKDIIKTIKNTLPYKN